MEGPRTVTFVTEVTHLRVLDVVYPPSTEYDTHVHDEAYACLVVEGRYRDWAPAGQEVVPGTFQTWGAGSRHAVRTGPEPVRIVHIADPDDRGSLAMHPLSMGVLWQLAAQLSTEPLAHIDEVGRLGIECLVAELTGPPHGHVDPSDRRSPSGDATWVERVRARLRDGFRDPASLEELAALAGRHPSHVTRAFRERWGMTPGEYMRRIRVAEAVRLIQESEMSLSAVAYAAGFADQSHLGRWMRRFTGRTPGELRRRSRQ